MTSAGRSYMKVRSQSRLKNCKEKPHQEHLIFDVVYDLRENLLLFLYRRISQHRYLLSHFIPREVHLISVGASDRFHFLQLKAIHLHVRLEL